MLTREQITTIARGQGLPLHTIERDYVQHLMLRHVTKSGFIFKGGTCLRIAYGSPRYSEDLDFNSDSDKGEVAGLFLKTARSLADYGIQATLVEEQTASHGFSARLRYEGPLFDGRPISKGTVRIEVSLRGEAAKSREVFVPRTPYPDVPQLVLVVLAEDHLFAEKTRALVVRQKPRDLFDIHFLMHRDVRCSRSLLDEKMRLYNTRFSLRALDAATRAVEKTWERDLEPLLGELPPYRQVASDVRSSFRRLPVGRS